MENFGMQTNEYRYRSLDMDMKTRFGEKVYKISINAGLTCPNRDGTLGKSGCIFCSKGGSGDFAGDPAFPITAQIENGKKMLREKAPDCKKFIAYFQAFTNTYAPVEKLRDLYKEAINNPEVVVLSIATRPDCLGKDVLDLLSELNKIKPVWVELGLQTIHEKTAKYIRRGFDFKCYEDAVHALQARNIEVVTHVILGLPGESRNQMLDTVRQVGWITCPGSRNTNRYTASGGLISKSSKIDKHTVGRAGIKLQVLHILKDTDLAEKYLRGGDPEFSFNNSFLDYDGMNDYVSTIIDCLELLPPEMVIHRLTGDGPKNLLVAPLWSMDKKKVLNTINAQLRIRDTYQGRLYR